MTNTWVYIKSEPNLWTVGFYDPQGKWQPESDHSNSEEAAKRVHYLNGGNIEKELTECDREECTYYSHYLVWYNPANNGPKLEHSAYHVAERRCTEAQDRYNEWMDNNPDKDPDIHASHLVRWCEMWERKVAA